MSNQPFGVPEQPAPTGLRTGTGPGWSDDPAPEQDICAPEIKAQYRCDGCTGRFLLRDLFLGDPPPGETLPEMRCIGCLHHKILQDNGGVGVDLATFHEIVGGPAVESQVRVP